MNEICKAASALDDGGPIAACARQVQEAVQAIDDEQTARGAMDKMEFLKAMLEAAHKWSEQAGAFLAMECLMWFQIAEVRWPSIKPPFKRGEVVLIDWIRTKGPDDREAIVRTCYEDRVSVKRQQLDEALEQRHQQMRLEKERLEQTWEDAFWEEADAIVNSIIRDGVGTCRLSFMDVSFSYKPSRKTVEAMTDHMRGRLRAAGAIGIGDGEGTYVMPGMADSEKVREAIRTRMEGVIADLRKIRSIVRETGASPSEHHLAALHDAVERLGEECPSSSKESRRVA